MIYLFFRSPLLQQIYNAFNLHQSLFSVFKCLICCQCSSSSPWAAALTLRFVFARLLLCSVGGSRVVCGEQDWLKGRCFPVPLPGHALGCPEPARSTRPTVRGLTSARFEPRGFTRQLLGSGSRTRHWYPWGSLNRAGGSRSCCSSLGCALECGETRMCPGQERGQTGGWWGLRGSSRGSGAAGPPGRGTAPAEGMLERCPAPSCPAQLRPIPSRPRGHLVLSPAGAGSRWDGGAAGKGRRDGLLRGREVRAGVCVQPTSQSSPAAPGTGGSWRSSGWRSGDEPAAGPGQESCGSGAGDEEERARLRASGALCPSPWGLLPPPSAGPGTARAELVPRSPGGPGRGGGGSRRRGGRCLRTLRLPHA